MENGRRYHAYKAGGELINSQNHASKSPEKTKKEEKEKETDMKSPFPAYILPNDEVKSQCSLASLTIAMSKLWFLEPRFGTDQRPHAPALSIDRK